MHSHDSTDALLRILTAPRRNRFFYGKRMDVQHFQMEQDYGKNKQWLLNRLTQGKGVLCGLKVSIDGNRLCVDPGVALDGLGREIIVPVRACIDPTAVQSPCCSGHPAHEAPGREPVPGRGPGHDPAAEQPVDGLFTLWLCYHECLADYQPVLVSDCDTRDRCAGGTVVETFCLKVAPGVPELQGDPKWCAKLWGHAHPEPEPAPHAVFDPAFGASAPGGAAAGPLPSAAEVAAAMKSRRHGLCTLFDCDCTADEGDPCVPLAVVAIRDGRIQRLESCLVRPRVYSNAVLLDLILCLAARIDECCEGHEPPAPQPPAPEPEPPSRLMRVSSVDFLARGRAGETTVGSVQSPLQPLQIPIAGQTNAIRIRFTQAFEQAAHKPSTHGLNDADFKRHNVMVLPLDPLNNLDYVPGELVIENAGTVRFDLHPESVYSRGTRGWQKGRYRLVLRGDDDLAAGRPALMDTASKALDGEAAAPAGGAISGNGAAGGDFILDFIVG
jgi:hypothetical protein